MHPDPPDDPNEPVRFSRSPTGEVAVEPESVEAVTVDSDDEDGHLIRWAARQWIYAEDEDSFTKLTT